MSAPLRPRLAWLCLALALLPGPARAADELEAGIRAVMGRPEYRHSRWGLLVVDLQTGKTVYEHNPDQLFAPASVTKLYSCAAALVAFGPDHRFRTPVYARGTLKDGVLTGDLILVGQGDLTLGGRTDAQGRLAFRNHDHIYAGTVGTEAALTDTDPLAGLRDLARQVRKQGVRTVTGDVLVDDRLFDKAAGSGSGPAVLTPVLVNDNLVDVVVTPAAFPGRPAQVTLRPWSSLVQVDAQVDTVLWGPTRIRVERVGPQRFAVRGQTSVLAGPAVRICPVLDPTTFARALFLDALREAGVTVRASALKPPRAELPERTSYARLKRVAVHTSPPFAEVLKVTLKVSHNLYASTLPLLLAVKEGRRTLAEGMRSEGKILKNMGVAVEDIALESGAGGGNGDRVSPRVTVQLLRCLARRPDFPVFKAALPLLGVDGTLADVVPHDSPARGKVWAKTGTFGDSDLLNGRILLRSKALGGVMTTARGRQLAFAFFVNDVPLAQGGSPSREGKALGRLCEIVYQHAP